MEILFVSLVELAQFGFCDDAFLLAEELAFTDADGDAHDLLAHAFAEVAHGFAGAFEGLEEFVVGGVLTDDDLETFFNIFVTDINAEELRFSYEDALFDGLLQC